MAAREFTSPLRSSETLDEGAIRGSWVLTEGVRDASGKMVAEGVHIGCPPPGVPAPNSGECSAEFAEGAYNWTLYQPADRFWLFQGIETGIFIGLAAVLLYLAVRRIRRIA